MAQHAAAPEMSHSYSGSDALRILARPLAAVAIALLLLPAQGSATTEADPTVARRQTLEKDYRKQIARFADDCQRQGLIEAARQLREWTLPPVAKGQRLYLPRLSAEADESLSPTSVEDPTTTSKSTDLHWRLQWRKLRIAQAERLWQLASEALDAGEYDTAFCLVYQVLREDPDHALARRIARLDGASIRQSRDSADRFRIRRTRMRHPKYLWKRNEHWRLESPHYLLVTNASPDAGERLLGQLEDLHAAWYQLFRRFVDNDATLIRLWKEGRKPRRPRSRHRVVMFANRSEYLERLLPAEPQIGISQGVYRAADRTAFFYAGDSVSPGTWRHEATHQLFHELGHARGQVGLDANFWIVEGIAIYLESLRRGPDYCTVGGVDADRLQFARYRRLSEQFYVRLADLVPLGRKSFQGDSRIRRLYSQSAGLAHLLMDYDDGHYRDPLIRYLQVLYDRRDDTRSLAAMTGVSLAQLDAEYLDFLQVTDDELVSALACGATRQLCLAGTGVTDAGLRGISLLDQLEWLDLTGCRVGDRTILSLARGAPLRQVNVEGTSVSDASLAHLATYETLEELDLSRTRITDAGVEHLAGMGNLKVLWLTGTHVTDAVVDSLRQLRHLELLELSETDVSDAARQQLQDALPQLRSGKNQGIRS